MTVRWTSESGKDQPTPLMAGIPFSIFRPWIALKDAGWIAVIGLVCVAVFAISSIAARRRQIQSIME